MASFSFFANPPISLRKPLFFTAELVGRSACPPSGPAGACSASSCLCPMQAGVRPSAPMPQVPGFLWGEQDLLLQERPSSAALPGTPTIPAAVGAQEGPNEVWPTTLWNSACCALRSGSCFPGGAAISPRLTRLARTSFSGLFLPPFMTLFCPSPASFFSLD